MTKDAYRITVTGVFEEAVTALTFNEAIEKATKYAASLNMKTCESIKIERDDTS